MFYDRQCETLGSSQSTTGFRGKSGCRASLCKDGAHMAQ